MSRSTRTWTWTAVIAVVMAGGLTLALAGGGAFLGVRVSEETELDEGGARVDHVVDESPAAAAGIRPGDIIVGFGGDPIRGPGMLTRRIHESNAGDAVAVEVIRDGSRQTLTAELGESHSRTWFHGDGEDSFVWPGMSDEARLEYELQMEKAREDMERAREQMKDLDIQIPHLRHQFRFAFGRPLLGVELVEVTDDLRRHFGTDREAGVLVGKVLTGSAAEKAGIEVGDLIMTVGGDTVRHASDVIEAVQENAGESVAIEVLRDGRSVELEADLAEPEEETVGGPRAYRVAPHPVVVPTIHMSPAPVAPEIRVSPPRPVAPVAPIREPREI